MPSDLMPVLRRVEAYARDGEAEARRDGYFSASRADAILLELSGRAMEPDARVALGFDNACAVSLAKAVRLLASMLAGRAGETLAVAGVLDGLAAPPPARSAWQWRSCLCCSAEFFSEGPGNRLCAQCRRRDADATGPRDVPAGPP